MNFKYIEKINWLEFLLLVVLFTLFIIKGVTFLDPDFGWRIRAGEMYMTSGIPKTDPFSYTMPSFPWVDHAWLISTLIFLVNKYLGITGLSVLFSSIAILSILIIYPNKKIEEKMFTISIKGKNINLGAFSDPVLILAFSVLFSYFGIRAQVFSWIMIAIFVKFLFDNNLWSRYRFFTPLFFLLWANLHGSYFSGLMLWFIVFFTRTLKKRKLPTVDLLLMLISVVVTFINPNNLGLWEEVLSSVFDNRLRGRIVEWMPTLTMLNFSIVLYIPLCLIFIWKHKYIFDLEKWIVFCFLLFEGLLSRRHFPLFVIFSYPMIIAALSDFYKIINKIKYGRDRFQYVFRIFLICTVLVVVYQITNDIREAKMISEEKFYPQKAIAYLKAVNPDENIFSDYGWGGYLVWKYQNKKVFIDGRMPSWKQDKETLKEENNAMDVYSNIILDEEGVDYKTYFNKYDIAWILWKKEKKDEKSLKINLNSIKFIGILDNLLRKEKKERKSILQRIKDDGWVVVYEDDISVVLGKPNALQVL